MRGLSSRRPLSRLRAALALCACVATVTAAVPRVTAAAVSATLAPSIWYTGCPRALFYSVRGSGESAGEDMGLGSPGKSLYDMLVRYYGRGVVGAEASGYPAVAISWTSPLQEMLGAGYTDSVAAGVEAGVADVADFARRCPSARVVLSGYSQGAQVVRGVLARLSTYLRGKVGAVVLFGDPLFSPYEPNVESFGDYVPPNVGLLHTPDTAAIDAAYAGGVFSDCHAFDVVCQTVGTTEAHGMYAADGATAAEHVTARLAMYGFAPPRLFFNRCVHTRTYDYPPDDSYTFCDSEETVRARLDLSDLVRIVPPHPVWRGMDVSPDHRRIVYSARPASNDRAPLYVRNLATGATRQLTFPAAGATDDTPRWSADGTRVFYNHAYYANGRMGAEIHVVPFGGGAATRIAGERSGLSVKPDGTRLAVLNGSTIYWDAIAPDGANRTPLMTTFFDCVLVRIGTDFEPWNVWSAWAPDNSRIAVTDLGCGTDRGTIYVAAAHAGTTPKFLVSAPANHEFCGLAWTPDALRLYSVVCDADQMPPNQEKAYGTLARTSVTAHTTTYLTLPGRVADIVVR